MQAFKCAELWEMMRAYCEEFHYDAKRREISSCCNGGDLLLPVIVQPKIYGRETNRRATTYMKKETTR